MNREELPQEASREDKMRDALKHYEELATKACWHRSDIPDAIRAYYASLPPAECAEAIVKKYEDEYDFKFHWVQRDRVIRMMREFAAQQPKLDPKKVQWSGYGELGNISQKPLQPTAEGAEEILRKNCNTCYSRSTGEEEVWSSVSSVLIAMQDFATLHAQRIADKMVSERSEFIKKAVIRFFYTEVDLNFCTREYRDRVEWYFNTYQHEIFKLPKTSLDNFKSRDSHESV